MAAKMYVMPSGTAVPWKESMCIGDRREALPWASRNTCQRAGAAAVLHAPISVLSTPNPFYLGLSSPNSGEAQNEFDL